MIVVFDLDYTLLNTKKFKAGLAQALGITARNFARYEQNTKNLGKNYNLDEHLVFLEKNQDSNVQKKIKNFFKNLDQYLFPEAEPILKAYQKKGAQLILATFGNKDWQKRKIDNLKIKKYFNKIILTNENKSKALDFLKNSKAEVLIINDKAKESLEIQKVLGKGKIFLITGPYTQDTEHQEKIITFKELLMLL